MLREPKGSYAGSRKRLLSIVDAISGHLRKAVIVLLAVLLISQILLQVDLFRHWFISADQWEGTRMN